MNAVPSSYTYHVLKNDLQDAFLEKGTGIGASFYKVLPMLRIDYCLADKRLAITGCAVIKEKLSDHYPVLQI
jgi:endonuclease/exonuclease/phosphatase family metal-dependent hydrolase